jgi:hypothetical protein
VTVELVEAAPVAGALRFRLVRHASAAAPRPGQKPPKQKKSAARARSHSHPTGHPPGRRR